MFDDTDNQPEDMFEAIDDAIPRVVPPTDLSSGNSTVPPSSAHSVKPTPIAERVQEAGRKHVFPWRMTILILGLFVVMGSAFLLSIKIWGWRTSSTPLPPEQLRVTEDQPSVEETEEPSVLEQEEEAPSVSRADTDKDGLTDEEEQEYGTSIRSEDTDADGLFDLEEIRTWETDPLNPDTDGDGYLDGEEVTAGYNPNGLGVLREAPTESD